MGQSQGFSQILIKAKDTGNGPCDLGDFDGMGEPGAVVIAFMIHKNLGFMLEAPEGGGMDTRSRSRSKAERGGLSASGNSRPLLSSGLAA